MIEKLAKFILENLTIGEVEELMDNLDDCIKNDIVCEMWRLYHGTPKAVQNEKSENAVSQQN